MTKQATILENIQSISTEQLQREVMELLHWNPIQFYQFQYETGLAYLEAYFGKDKQAIRLLEGKAEFWNWFKNHWFYRDQSFFETFMLDQETPLALKREMYQGLHEPAILACEIYPSRQVLGKEFTTVSIQFSS